MCRRAASSLVKVDERGRRDGDRGKAGVDRRVPDVEAADEGEDEDDEEVRHLDVGEGLGAEAHDREDGEQTEAETGADRAGGHDDHGEEEPDVEQRVDDDEIRAPVPGPVDRVDEHGDRDEVDREARQNLGDLKVRGGHVPKAPALL
jgi:hypothetical protein